MKRYVLMTLISALWSCHHDQRPDVVSKIQQASKLVTTETVVGKIVFGTKEKKLLGVIRLNEARFAAWSTAYITSGIDIHQLRASDVKAEGSRIELTLPGVEIISFRYPFDEFHIDESLSRNRLLNRITAVDQENFYRLAENGIRESLPYLDIERSTQTKTRLLLTELLHQLGYSEVYISFRPFTLNTNPL